MNTGTLSYCSRDLQVNGTLSSRGSPVPGGLVPLGSGAAPLVLVNPAAVAPLPSKIVTGGSGFIVAAAAAYSDCVVEPPLGYRVGPFTSISFTPFSATAEPLYAQYTLGTPYVPAVPPVPGPAAPAVPSTPGNAVLSISAGGDIPVNTRYSYVWFNLLPAYIDP